MSPWTTCIPSFPAPIPGLATFRSCCNNRKDISWREGVGGVERERERERERMRGEEEERWGGGGEVGGGV